MEKNKEEEKKKKTAKKEEKKEPGKMTFPLSKANSKMKPGDHTAGSESTNFYSQMQKIREASQKAPMLRSLPDVMRAGDMPTQRESMETLIIKRLMKSYFKVVRKNISDLVPKTVMAFLVNKSRQVAQNELVAKLFLEKNFDELMEEDPTVAEKRKECKEMIKVYSESLTALNSLKETES